MLLDLGEGLPEGLGVRAGQQRLDEQVQVQVAQVRLGGPVHSTWLSLAGMAMAQLMVVLDATMVNTALPTAQADLGLSNDSR